MFCFHKKQLLLSHFIIYQKKAFCGGPWILMNIHRSNKQKQRAKATLLCYEEEASWTLTLPLLMWECSENASCFLRLFALALSSRRFRFRGFCWSTAIKHEVGEDSFLMRQQNLHNQVNMHHFRIVTPNAVYLLFRTILEFLFWNSFPKWHIYSLIQVVIAASCSGQMDTAVN